MKQSKYDYNSLNKWINEENLSYEEIGRKYGVTGNAIKKAAKRIGITLLPRKDLKNSKGEKVRKCINCGKILDYTASKFCSKHCQMDFRYKEYISLWKSGKVDGVIGKADISLHIRHYLFEKHHSKCQICGWSQINPVTGKVPLQIHHIDGDCLNNKEDNLQLLCPNCHSLTPTFGNLNSNSKRKYRKH